MIRQLNVFIENRSGRLYEVCRVLGDAGINIRGFSVADMSEFGIFRLIVVEPDRAREVLKKAGFSVSESEVLVVGVPDRPGGLAQVLSIFAREGISVEYMYIIAQTKLAFALDDNEKAQRVLVKEGIPVLTEKDIANL